MGNKNAIAMERSHGEIESRDEQIARDSNVDGREEEWSDKVRGEMIARIHSGDRYALMLVPKEAKEDFQVVLAAMKLDGCDLRYASQHLQATPAIVIAAVLQDGRALEYASKKLQAMPDIVLAAVLQNGLALEFASAELRNNKEVAMAAVCESSSGGRALQHVSDELRSDAALILAAVSRHGRALEYASAKLRATPEIVLAAVNSDGHSLQYASLALRADKSFIHSVVSEQGFLLEHAPPVLRNDEEVVLTATSRHSWALEHASDDLRANHRFISRAIIVSNNNALHFASDAIKSDLRCISHMFDTLDQAKQFLLHGLLIYPAFMEFLLCVKSESDVPVTMLNLGEETDQELHRHIAGYAGVVLDEQRLKHVRLVKCAMPIVEALFLGADDQDLALLNDFTE